jgi:hydrogenase nickel incorporation protein HypA/HybF
MHEAALFRELRNQLVSLAEREHAGRISRAEIWLGALSHVREAQLRSEWPRLVAGTPAEGALLEVQTSDEVTDPQAQSVILRSISLREP